jgi:cytidylate kinase
MITFSEYLSEGVNDPAIFKVVFLAGGPGSGKSFMVKKAALQSMGFVVLNSDDAFEHMMKKSGLDLKMPESEKEQRDIARDAAKATTSRREDLAIVGRLGLVIDGTGRDYDKIMKMRGHFATKGYDSAMVFVNTDLETALDRNAKRARSVPDDIASRYWNDVQSNLGKFQQAFRKHFYIIDNSEGSDYDKQTLAVFKKISAWVKEPPNNGVAKKWIQQQRKGS